MYFLFLTCEIKCGAAVLNIADRQNAYNIIIAVRDIVELFKFIKRKKKFYREIFVFLISHDYRAVRIYGYYSITDGNKTTFYRHSIREFSFTELENKEKWSAYKFTKNVYDIWMLTYFKRICSVINELLFDINFKFLQ
jgi:hypothetical protein